MRERVSRERQTAQGQIRSTRDKIKEGERLRERRSHAFELGCPVWLELPFENGFVSFC